MGQKASGGILPSIFLLYKAVFHEIHHFFAGFQAKRMIHFLIGAWKHRAVPLPLCHMT
jgi:hypothetical protein